MSFTTTRMGLYIIEVSKPRTERQISDCLAQMRNLKNSLPKNIWLKKLGLTLDVFTIKKV